MAGQLPDPTVTDFAGIRRNFDAIVKRLAALESQQITWGAFDDTGATIIAGSGDWSVERTGVGVYVLTFTDPFESAPIVLTELDDVTTNLTSTQTVAAGSATLRSYDSATGAAADAPIGFLAFGART